MCNLYSQTKSQDAMRHVFDVVEDDTGNLPPMPGIFPDYNAPIITAGPVDRRLRLARWGMPTPPQFLDGKRTDPGVTNIRNTASPHWRRWLGVHPHPHHRRPEPGRAPPCGHGGRCGVRRRVCARARCG